MVGQAGPHGKVGLGQEQRLAPVATFGAVRRCRSVCVTRSESAPACSGAASCWPYGVPPPLSLAIVLIPVFWPAF